MAEKPSIHGLVADFDSPDKLMDAIKAARKAGYSKMEAYTPFPIHGIDDAMGAPPSILGYLVLCGSATGLTIAVLLQWWTGAVAYPLVIAGKPFFALEPSVPIMFELTVLLSAFAAVGGMLVMNRLPRWNHPVFEWENFTKVSDASFAIVIELRDPKFSVAKVSELLETVGGTEISVIREEA